EDEALPPGVPYGDGEHAAQPLGEALPVLLVEVDEHLGVRLCPEAMSGALEAGSELAVVVDLPVLDDVDSAVLVGDRLGAGLAGGGRGAGGGGAPPGGGGGG